MSMELNIDQALSLIENGDLKRGENEYTHYYLIDELKNILHETGFFEIKLYPTTVFTELIPTAWLLDEIPLKKFLDLEIKARKYKELLSYGVRIHFYAKK